MLKPPVNRQKPFKKGLGAGLAKDSSGPCWSHHEINIARLIRRALSHSGGRETEDLKKQKDGVKLISYSGEENRMRRLIAILGLFLALSEAVLGADRVMEVEKLIREYRAAEKKTFETPSPKNPTSAEKIHRYEAFPGWRYIPRFLELAEAKPNDEAAYRCCQWIIARTGNVGTRDKRIFEADQKAWEILAAYHTQRSELAMLCLQAAKYSGPARERFLRGLLKRKDLSRENMGFATVALAELLAHKYEYLESFEPSSSQDEFTCLIERQKSPDWGRDLIPANAPQFKAESIQLFRDVSDRFANVPVTISAPYFRSLKNLGEKASKSLHALEYLTIGSESPSILGNDLEGKPLDLSKYRGRVVMVSFWFTGCGPCTQMIPEERHLLETYKGRPFALLSVCTDGSLVQAKKTAASRGIDWPCWFDGENGPIARDWNVLSWPTIYLLDQRGAIVTKHLRGEKLERKIAELMKERK